MLLIVMGVSGSGKTTVGVRLAQALGAAFLEGDSLHPASNIAKMSNGIPLDDADRAPWLAAIRVRLETAARQESSLVTACSALKQKYRDFLATGLPVTTIYLKGSESMLYQRLKQRQGHYMKADMLASQLATLEEPRDAIVVDAAGTPHEITRELLRALARWPR